MLYIGLGLGAIVVDMGIQVINNGISITRTIYETGCNLMYGKPKSDTERIEELTKRIEKLTNDIEILQSQR